MKNEIDVNKYYKRNIDKELAVWSKNNRDKTIALIGGARRTGKTHSLCFLGKTQFDRYEIIDVQNLSEKDLKLMMDKDKRVSNFISFLLSKFGVSIDEINENLLIIFDEIQEHNELKESISIFNKELKCRFACTGSALWIDDTNGTRPTPDFKKFQVYPFSFSQFINIINEGKDLFEKERESFAKYKNIRANSNLLRLLRLYMVIGGMPQSIQCYLDNINNPSLFSLIHETKKVSIVSTYENDLNRYSNKFKEPLFALYKDIIREIGKYREKGSLNNAFDKLEQMNLVLLSKNLNDINRKLSSSIDDRLVKPYLLDVGILFYYFCDNFNLKVVESLSRQFVCGKDSDDNGYLYENYVASTLIQHGYIPYFKMFEDEDDGECKKYELDFVFSGIDETIVIESKSGSPKEHKSLERGLKKYDKLKRSFILCKSYKIDKSNLHKGPHFIPFYALDFILEE